jgi:hypothetical protein
MKYASVAPDPTPRTTTLGSPGWIHTNAELLPSVVEGQMRRHCMGATLIAACSLAIAAQGVNAGLVVTLESVTPFGSNFDYSYAVSGPNTEGLLDSYFTLLDIPGLVTVESLSVNWQASGGNGSGPALKNVTFSYTIPPQGGEGSRPPYTTPRLVGLIRSTYNNIALGNYLWQDKDGYPTGLDQTGSGTVNIPSVSDGTGGGGGGPTPVPEPDTLSLFIASLIGLRLMLRRRGAL